MGETVELLFLGTGGTAPFGERKFPCTLILRGKLAIFLDFGECCQFAILRSGKRILSKDLLVLISHPHADHFSGLLTFLQTLYLAEYKKKLTVIAPSVVIRYLSRAVDLKSLEINAEFLTYEPCLDGRVLLHLEDTIIRAVRTKHIVTSCGFLIEFSRTKLRRNSLSEIPHSLRGRIQQGFYTWSGNKILNPNELTERISFTILFSGDTLPIRPHEKVNIIIHEATYIDEEFAHSRGHSKLSDLTALSRLADKVFAIHISPRYKQEELLEKLRDIGVPENVIIPNDGDVYTFSF